MLDGTRVRVWRASRSVGDVWVWYPVADPENQRDLSVEQRARIAPLNDET